MVVGKIQGLKVREGHWTAKAEGRSRLLIKLDEKPTVLGAEQITLVYGPRKVPVEVKLLEWNDRSGIALAEITSSY